MQRDELVHYLNQYLRIDEIKDYGPQGLQIEGRSEVNTIVGAVDSHLPCVEAALLHEADLMLVHHGIMWGPARLLSGHYGLLVRTLMMAHLNLYAAHLALDGHPEVGNNVELARRLGLEVSDWWAPFNGVKIGVIAAATQGVSFAHLVDRFAQNVGRPNIVQPFGAPASTKVAILSGGGAGEIEAAVALGCDTIITGETSHVHYYDAQNLGVNVLYGGHYTSETVGVQALGEHLANRFNLSFRFVDLPTGV
jgi:dinuclear metal center YbgI/SA1388 family protein